MDSQPTVQVNNSSPSGDHDLLLTLKAEVTTKLDRVISDVKDLRDDTVARISNLEAEKLNITVFNTYKTELQKDIEEHKKQSATTHDNQQKQIDWASNWIRYGLGALGILNFLLGALQVYKLFHP